MFSHKCKKLWIKASTRNVNINRDGEFLSIIVKGTYTHVLLTHRLSVKSKSNQHKNVLDISLAKFCRSVKVIIISPHGWRPTCCIRYKNIHYLDSWFLKLKHEVQSSENIMRHISLNIHLLVTLLCSLYPEWPFTGVFISRCDHIDG